MSMGLVFWIILLVLLSMMILRLANQSSNPANHKKLDAKTGKKGRSLSEVPSEEYSNRLNKRFDQTDALEDEQRSRCTSEESLIKRSEARPQRPLPLSNTKDSSSEWVYANPALVMNEPVSAMTRQHSNSPAEKVYSIPRTFTTMQRSISRDESETSESRKLGLFVL